MKIPRAVPMLAVPAVLLMVPFAALGLFGQIFSGWQGGFITGFPVTGWLQDVLGPSALEGLLLGGAYGAYRLYRKKIAKDADTSAWGWIQRHRSSTTIASLFLVGFVVWRVWWIFFSGLYIGNFTAVVQRMNAASELQIYRGLPARYEKAYEAEIKKPNIERHGFHFYADARKLSAEETQTIKSTLSRRYLFTSKPVFRLCGGFHPDLSVAFKHGGDYEIQLCLGCGEVRVYGPDGRVDLAMHYHGKLELEKVQSELFKDLPTRANTD